MISAKRFDRKKDFVVRNAFGAAELVRVVRGWRVARHALVVFGRQETKHVRIMDWRSAKLQYQLSKLSYIEISRIGYEIYFEFWVDCKKVCFYG